MITSPRCNHGLGRWLERHDGAHREVAGAGPARAGGGLADSLDGSRTCTAHDRCLRAGPGRVPAGVRAGGCGPGRREPRPCRSLRTGVELAAESPGCERDLDRLGCGAGERDEPAAAGCRCVCSTTSSWRRGCGNPIRSAGGATTPPTDHAESSTGYSGKDVAVQERADVPGNPVRPDLARAYYRHDRPQDHAAFKYGRTAPVSRLVSDRADRRSTRPVHSTEYSSSLDGPPAESPTSRMARRARPNLNR